MSDIGAIRKIRLFLISCDVLILMSRISFDEFPSCSHEVYWGLLYFFPLTKLLCFVLPFGLDHHLIKVLLVSSLTTMVFHRKGEFKSEILAIFSSMTDCALVRVCWTLGSSNKGVVGLELGIASVIT